MRSSTPLRVHQIWDAIGQGGVTPVDDDKLSELFSELYAAVPTDELNREIEYAVADGLVTCEAATNAKKEEIQVYKLPEAILANKGDHDWYCFKCHVGGSDDDMLSCEDCPRVFHAKCLKEDQKKPQKDLFICPPCHQIQAKPSSDKLGALKPKQLNQLLDYIIKRFRDWDIDFLDKSDGKIWAIVGKRSQKEAWRFNYLVYQPMDLNIMSEKAAASKYTSIEEFQVDCETLVHAIGVYFGPDLLKGGSLGASFYRDAIHDIKEVMLCHDCFRSSNEKDHAYWFCLPCTTPHQVVWAKQAGYPYWPAKVMKIDGNKYDCRYFGSYERGLIDSKNIKNIETPIADLKVRKTAAWNDAFDELEKFQNIAKNPEMVHSLPKTRGKSSGGVTPAKSKVVKRASNVDLDSGSAKKARSSLSTQKLTPTQKPKAVVKPPTSSGRGRKPDPSPPPRKSTVTSNGLGKTPAAPGKKQPGGGKGTPSSQVKSDKSGDLRVLHAESSARTDDSQSSVATDGIGDYDDDLSFFDQESSDSEDETTNDVYFSEDENSKAHNDKGINEDNDTVSSSVVDSKKFRSVYTQVNNPKAPLSDYWREKCLRKLNSVRERYLADISICKKKQWCYNCEKEAIYHCCWNTAYCSIECQQTHWTREHKKACRRVRRERTGGIHEDYC